MSHVAGSCDGNYCQKQTRLATCAEAECSLIIHIDMICIESAVPTAMRCLICINIIVKNNIGEIAFLISGNTKCKAVPVLN
jgi:hypothetical protein